MAIKRIFLGNTSVLFPGWDGGFITFSQPFQRYGDEEKGQAERPTKYAKKVQLRYHVLYLALAYVLTCALSSYATSGYMVGLRTRVAEQGLLAFAWEAVKKLPYSHPLTTLGLGILLVIFVLLFFGDWKGLIKKLFFGSIALLVPLYGVLKGWHPFFILMAVCVALFLVSRFCVGKQELPKAPEAPDDQLNRTSIANLCVNYVVKAIKDTSPKKRGARVAIYDAWGSGKSFVLEMVRATLEDPEKNHYEKKIRTVVLDPWSFETPEEALEKMAEAVEAALLDFRNYPLIKNKYVRKLLVHLQHYLPSNSFTGSLYSLICHPDDVCTPARIKTIDENLDEPVVLFIDDMERAMPEIMKALLAALDRIREIKNLHIIAAIEEKAFTAAFDNRETAIGYLNKVFAHQIRLPRPTPWDLRELAQQRIPKDSETGETKFPLTTQLISHCIGVYVDAMITPKTPRGILQVTESMQAMENSVSSRYGEKGQNGKLNRLFQFMYFLEALRYEFPGIHAELTQANLHDYVDMTVLENLTKGEHAIEEYGPSIQKWKENYPLSYNAFSTNRHALSYAQFLKMRTNVWHVMDYSVGELQEAIDLLVYRNSTLTEHETETILDAARNNKEDYLGDMRHFIQRTLGLNHAHPHHLMDFWGNVITLVPELSINTLDEASSYTRGLIRLAKAQGASCGIAIPPVIKVFAALLKCILHPKYDVSHTNKESEAAIYRKKRTMLMHALKECPADIFLQEWWYIHNKNSLPYRNERTEHIFLTCCYWRLTDCLKTDIFDGKEKTLPVLATIADIFAKLLQTNERHMLLFRSITIPEGQMHSYTSHTLLFVIASKMYIEEWDGSYMRHGFIQKLLWSASQLEPSRIEGKQLEQAQHECDSFMSLARKPEKGYKAVFDLAEAFMKKVAALKSSTDKDAPQPRLSRDLRAR